MIIKGFWRGDQRRAWWMIDVLSSWFDLAGSGGTLPGRGGVDLLVAREIWLSGWWMARLRNGKK